MTDVQFIGDRILSAADLEAMNVAEIKSRKYRFCTIVCGDGSRFDAKVAYCENSESWEPVSVMITPGYWVGVDSFEEAEAGHSYSCENYRETLNY